MELSCRMSLRPELQLSERISNEDYEDRYFGDFKTSGWAYCPGCGYQLNEMEIMEGFSSDDSIELRTTCPKCKEMFMAELLIKNWCGERTLENVEWYCPEQTIHKMITIIKNRKRLGVKYLAEKDRDLYYNMVRYWDSYDNAIRAMKAYMIRQFLKVF